MAIFFNYYKLLELLHNEYQENKKPIVVADRYLISAFNDPRNIKEVDLSLWYYCYKKFTYASFNKRKRHLLEMLRSDVEQRASELVNDWLTKEELSQPPYNIAVNTQSKLRTRKNNPLPYYNPPGVGVIYRKGEIDAWMLQGKVI